MMTHARCFTLSFCCGALLFSGLAVRPATAKTLPPPFAAPAVPIPADPAHRELAAALAAAKAAGDEAIAQTLEARLRPAIDSAVAAPSPSSSRVIRRDGRSPVTGGQKWGGDVLVTDPALPSGSPALACQSDGTLYAAVERQGQNAITLYWSHDGGATWQLYFDIVSTVALTEPVLAIGEGLANRLLIAFVHGSGTYAASVDIFVENLDTETGTFSTALSYPYMAIAHPRICVDSPEYSYWYPYLVCMVQGIDSDELRFTRSFDYGDTWLPSQALATNVSLADLPDVDFGGTALTVVHSRTGTDSDIHARISRDFGNTWEPAFPLTGSGMEEIEPRVATTAAGDAMLVAFARRYAPGNCDIDGVWSNDQGATWQGTYLPYSGEDERRPAVVASPVTGRLHAAYWRDGGIRYTAADLPQSWYWSESLRVDDRGAAADAWPTLATRPAPCGCNPDMNCDGVIDVNDLAAFELAMYDPVEYGNVYPNCDIDQGDLDCDGDIDLVDYAGLECLVTGGSDCCPAMAVSAGIAWHDGQPPVPGVWFDAVNLALPPAAVSDGPPVAPLLGRIHPNPFNAATTIGFTLPADGRVRLAVYAATGRRIAVLTDDIRSAGDHEVTWNGRDARGRSCPSSVYFVRIDAAGRTEVWRMTLIR